MALKKKIYLFKQFLRFVSVGAIGTVGHYSTLILMVEVGKVDAVISSASGFLVGAIINYILNYYLTFRSKSKHLVTMAKFFFVAILTGSCNVLVMYFTVNYLMINYLLSQIMATTIILIINYLANLLWTFKKKEEYLQ